VNLERSAILVSAALALMGQGGQAS